ncbi:leucyl aminopeptidase [Gammaproteobacteria bacterium]|nr:leucyl aminopeptidase [Gammaproteobacteria bacterium]
MKYIRFNRNTKAEYNLIFIYEDKLPNLNKSVLNDTVLEDVKLAISNKLVTGACGSMNTFSSKMYEKNYFLVGLGKKSKLTIQAYEKNLNSALKKINGYNINSISVDLNNISIKGYDHIKGGIIEIEKTQYSYKQKNSSSLKECLINVSSKVSNKHLSNTIDISVAIANGLNKARMLGDTPPNICNPTFLAKEAKKLEKLNRNLKVEILDEKQMRTLKMGSLLSVSHGSTQPAKLVIIKYMPIKNKQPIVLVGKGITFDTGGISLKPSPNMDEMKYDMSGAGSVIGAMQACAEMNLKNNVIGILACAENMPSGVATRPGDVVTSMSGITIEILNTDAEGRLVLCDALTFSKKYKPRYILDMATLTGACLVGLGKYPSGLFSNNDALTKKIKSSADNTGDRVWELPLYHDYFDELKTNFADIQNIGGRYGGAITAAAFLANFTKGEKWAHLDIAGTAWDSGNDKGSTGRPVKLLTDFVMTNK